MGREKALLELSGKPLIERAVSKLNRVCGHVAILSSNPALAKYAPLVQDLHPGCGPMAGMEAALVHSAFAWNLFLPVDVPFLPTAYLKAWTEALPQAAAEGVRVWIFTVEGTAQPTVALIHREVRPFLTEALELGRYKVLPVLERAALELGRRHSSPEATGLRKVPYWPELRVSPGADDKREEWEMLTEAQKKAGTLWFENLNTPEEFAEAERLTAALDT